MGDARCQLRFAQEPRPPLVVRGEVRRQDLQRDVPTEPLVTGAVDLAHAAHTELFQDIVVCKGTLDGAASVFGERCGRPSYPRLGPAPASDGPDDTRGGSAVEEPRRITDRRT